MSRKLTKLDREFIFKAKGLGCVVQDERCGGSLQFHHITQGGRRMGHRFGLCLCENHHEGKFSIGNAKKSFIAMYGTELELCQKMYKMLGMEYKPKESKLWTR